MQSLKFIFLVTKFYNMFKQNIFTSKHAGKENYEYSIFGLLVSFLDQRTVLYSVKLWCSKWKSVHSAEYSC